MDLWALIKLLITLSQGVAEDSYCNCSRVISNSFLTIVKSYQSCEAVLTANLSYMYQH